MKRRLPEWAILGGGTAVAAAAFFASAGITHWAMDLHQTDVVVRPGPTVYVTKPAGHGHIHQQAGPAPAAAGPGHGGGDPSRLAAHARPDHREKHHRGGNDAGHAHGH